MKKPKLLKEGDKIALLAPSGGAAAIFKHRVEAGIGALRRLGLEPVVYPSVSRIDKNGAGPAEDRAREINSAFADQKIGAIMAVTGGLTANQILEYLDYECIRQNPKPFIGYSDNTVIHCALLTKCHLISFYGPCLITQFGEYPDVLGYTRNSFIQSLMNSEPMSQIQPSDYWTDEMLDWGRKLDLLRPRKLKTNEGGHFWIRKGAAEGALVGGCLPSLVQVLGTPYAPTFDGKLLVLETPEGSLIGKGQSLGYVRKDMWTLRNAGVFEKIRGIVFGRGYGYSEDENKELLAIVDEATTGHEVPILANVNVGHADPILTLPLGVNARLSSADGYFGITESCIE